MIPKIAETADPSPRPSPPGGERERRRRRRWLRFSLRTLVLLVLLIGSGATLWWNWGPWELAFIVNTPVAIRDVRFSDDDRFVLIHYVKRMPDPSRGNRFFNSLDVYRADSGQRHALLEDDVENTQEVLINGPYAAFLPGSWMGMGPTEPPVRVYNYVESRELNCKDKFKRDDDVATYFQLEGGRILVPFVSPQKQSTVVYRLPNFEQEWQSKGDTNQMLGAKLMSDGRLAVFEDGAIQVHDFIAGRVVKSPPIAEKIEELEFKGGNRYIDASFKLGIDSHGSYLFEIGSGQLRRFDPSGPEIWTISPDGNRAIRHIDDDTDLIDMPSGKVVKRLEKQAGDVVFSPYNSLMLDQNNARMYDAATGNLLWKDEEGEFCTLSPDGTVVLRGLEIRNPRTGERVMAPQSRLHPIEPGLLYDLHFAHHSNQFALYASETFARGVADLPARRKVSVWRLRRPWAWWGVACMPEFWLTVMLGVGLVWSVWRGRGMEKRV